MSAGIKFDEGKPQLSMLPKIALDLEAEVMAFGARKYGKWNYLSGMKWSRLLDAAMRHITAFAEGENNDPETGLSHLAHVRCCMGFLLEYLEKNLGEDDRKTYDKISSNATNAVGSLGDGPDRKFQIDPTRPQNGHSYTSDDCPYCNR